MQAQSSTTAREVPGPLPISVTYAVDHVVITLAGDLDLHVESAVLATLSAAHRPGVVAMRIDATAIAFLDASGIRSLLAARQLAHEHELMFSLVTSEGGPVVRLLSLCGLTNVFADSMPAQSCL